jgi:hypothetical protein
MIVVILCEKSPVVSEIEPYSPWRRRRRRRRMRRGFLQAKHFLEWKREWERGLRFLQKRPTHLYVYIWAC